MTSDRERWRLMGRGAGMAVMAITVVLMTYSNVRRVFRAAPASDVTAIERDNCDAQCEIRLIRGILDRIEQRLEQKP